MAKQLTLKAGLLFRESPVDSTGLGHVKSIERHNTVDSTGLGHVKSIERHKYTVQWTPLDSNWTGACKIYKGISTQSSGLHQTPLDWGM